MISQKIRLYPTKEQMQYLVDLAGYSRHAYNMMLAKWNSEYNGGNRNVGGRNIRDWYKEYSKQNEPWTANYTNMVVETSSENLEQSFRNFFKKQCRHPEFHSKKKRLSFSINAKNKTTCRISEDNGNYYVHLNKNNIIRLAEKNKYHIPIKFIFSCQAGVWYLSICYRDDVQTYQNTGCYCGIDVGIKSLAVVVGSDNTERIYDIDKDYIGRWREKIDKYHNILSNKAYMSKSYKKMKAKLQSVYRHKDWYIDDYYKKAAHDIVARYDIIGIEDLDVRHMFQNRILSRSLQERGLSTFLNTLQAKAKLAGKQVVKVDRYYPSSQICHHCGGQFPITKDLSVREWDCPNCHSHLNRDENAAMNIRDEAYKLSQKI